MVLLGALIAAGLAIAAFAAVWFMPKVDKGKLACEGNLREKSVLPPGSMGLPFIGETLEYLSPFKSSNVGPFLHKRISRYQITNKIRSLYCCNVLSITFFVFLLIVNAALHLRYNEYFSWILNY